MNLTTSSLRIGALVLCATATACSSSSTSNPGPSSPTGTSDSGTDAGGLAGTSLNGCTTYGDLTSDTANHTIVWVRSVGLKCLKIKTGQKITWDPQETFDAHPLETKGGDTPNPITPQSTGSTAYTATFSTAGTFGFTCGVHPDMTGAIWVADQ